MIYAERGPLLRKAGHRFRPVPHEIMEGGPLFSKARKARLTNVYAMAED